MKTILKKLHIGSSSSSSSNNNDPSRPIDAAASATTTTTPASTDDSSPIASPLPATEANNYIPSSLAINSNNQSADFYSSEEEFQVQLALAISASNSDHHRPPALINLGTHATQNGEAAANSLSRQYWDYNVIDYGDKIVDGFYDVYQLSMDEPIQKHIPSIADLETSPGPSGFEVVIVNKQLDPSLEELLQVAHCISIDCTTAEAGTLVQRLAELVTGHMGGPVRDANIMLARWIERSTELRTSRQTSVLPIGTVNIGLSRHRALLFKVLADSIQLPCKLVKGSHYTGIEDDALNMIKLENEREYLVDLMAEPGTLIPADASSGKDFSIKAHNPSVPRIPAANEYMEGRYSDFKRSGHNSVVGNNMHMDRNSISDKSESSTLLPGTSDHYSDLFANSGTSTSDNPLDNLSLSATENSHKEGPVLSNMDYAVRKNINVVPYTEGSKDDTRNLFADLNPFQIKGPSKNLVPNKPLVINADEYQRQRNNAISGRPPIPLIPKNRYALNEVPRKNQYYNGDGLVPRNGRNNNDYNLSSNASPTSGTSEKPLSDALRSGSLYSADRYNGNSVFNEGTSQFDWAPTNVGGLVKKDYKDFQKEVSTRASQLEKKKSSLPDPKYAPDRTVEINMKAKERKNSRLTVDSSKSMDDQMFDDVGDCEIPWEHLVLYERIGLGSYGEVYNADWNGMEVAVKKFLDQDFSGAALEEFRREVRIMRGLRHPNVVHFVGAVTRPPNLSIITEFLPRGSLYRIIHRPQSYIDEKQRLKMALDVAQGMNCLHTSTPTIVHRDLKSPNLLVDSNWNVKVCDFGLSRLKHNTFLSSKSTAGTPEWMAPEVLRNEPSNEKCDVYSFGVILWELATLKLPWSDMNPMQVVGAVGFQNRRLEIPKEVDPLVARIIWECWQQDPSLRPSFAQLTVALRPLQCLQIPSNAEQQNTSMNLTP